MTRPPATAAEDPPEDPPAVRPSPQGLVHVPWILLVEMLSPPNSDASVWPTGTMPPRSTSRVWAVEEWSATRSANTSDSSV